MNALIEQIQQAFAGAEYPGDDNLTDSAYGEEPAALIEEFTGRTNWQEFDPAFLNQAPDGWGTALSFFSGDALRFYLPAYLIADIRGELDASDPATRLCSSLTPLGEKQKIARAWGGGTMGERARADFAKFSDAQIKAIVAYLRWKLETRSGNRLNIEQAMDNYWLKRLGDTTD